MEDEVKKRPMEWRLATPVGSATRQWLVTNWERGWYQFSSESKWTPTLTAWWMEDIAIGYKCIMRYY
jgi:hypothetical protein